MTNIDKLIELIKVVNKTNCFPVVYRSERNNAAKTIKFDDESDMAIFIQTMTTKYKNNNLPAEEKILYETFIKFKTLLQEQN